MVTDAIGASLHLGPDIHGPITREGCDVNTFGGWDNDGMVMVAGVVLRPEQCECVHALVPDATVLGAVSVFQLATEVQAKRTLTGEELAIVRDYYVSWDCAAE